MKANRYFVIRVPAGEYEFGTVKINGTQRVEFAGAVNSTRCVDIGNDSGVAYQSGGYNSYDGNCTKRDRSVRAAEPATGRAAIPKLTPIATGNVKIRTFVGWPRSKVRETKRSRYDPKRRCLRSFASASQRVASKLVTSF